MVSCLASGLCDQLVGVNGELRQLVETVFKGWLLPVYPKWTVFIKYLLIKQYTYKVLNALVCM